MLEDLLNDLESSAHWRRTVMEEHPDDSRNEDAAKLLERLESEIRSKSDSAIAREIEEIEEKLLRLSKGNSHYDLSSLSEECSEYRRRIGISVFPKDGDEYLSELLNIYKDNWSRAEGTTEDADLKQDVSSQSDNVHEGILQTGGMLNTAREAGEEELCLDVDDYAGVLAELFSHGDDGEFCFAIYGNWGRGKTFLARRLQKALLHLNKRYEVIYFSAWKYPSAPEVWVYLYETFAKAAFDRPWHIAIPNVIRTAIVKRGYSGLLIIYGMLAISVLPVLELLRVAEEVIKFVYVGIGATGLVWLWSLVRGVQRTGVRLTREYLTASRHTEKLGLQATIGTDLRILLMGWMPTEPFSRAFVAGYWSVTVLFLLGTWLRLTGWATIEAWTTAKFGWPVIANWQAGSAAVVVCVLVILLVSAFRWIRRGGSSPARLILVVDDLDRCRPEHLLSVMESIKLLIEEPEVSRRVQVAMLLEEEILKHAIFEKYGNLIDASRTAVLQTSYDADRLMQENCEKLFTASLRLPRLSRSELKDLIETFSGRRQELQERRDALLEEKRILNDRMNDKPSAVWPDGTEPTYIGTMVRGDLVYKEGPPKTIFRPATKEEKQQQEAEIEKFRARANPVLEEVDNAIAAVDSLLPIRLRWKEPSKPYVPSTRVLEEAEVSAVVSVLADENAQCAGILARGPFGPFSFATSLPASF
jgi:Cdc6-like AAA superfamily ATPase